MKNNIKILAEKIGEKCTISKRGVPYICMVLNSKQISICYFGRTDKYRVFVRNGFSYDDQKRIDFKTEEELIKYLKS